MMINHGFDHRQTQAHAIDTLGRRETPILAEQFGQFLGGNAFALIDEFAASATSVTVDLTHKRCEYWDAVLDGIFQQIEQRAGQQRLIGQNQPFLASSST